MSFADLGSRNLLAEIYKRIWDVAGPPQRRLQIVMIRRRNPMSRK
jgi:hypothetical protein